MRPAFRVNKASFLNAVVCPTRGWLTRHSPDTPTDGDQLRMDEGLEIGRRARSLYSSECLVHHPTLDLAAEQTKAWMADETVPAIFEATFIVDQYVAKADVLVRSGKGWKLIEVKSGIKPNSEYWEDLAYTLMVARRAGVKVKSAALLLISPDFRPGMDDQDLFLEHEAADDLWEIADDFDKLSESIAATVLGAERPAPKLIFACRSCTHFGQRCIENNDPDHIFDLPRLSKSLFNKLTSLNVNKISKIPKHVPLTASQDRVRKAVASGKPSISKNGLASFLRDVEWPAYYLDFETVKSAIPLFPGVGPHEQIVTQYSLHVCHAPGEVTIHHEFLADASGDQRRQLVEKLLEDLEESGSIIVYSSFEKTMLNGFAALFPDLKKELQRCVNRLFDLEKAFREHVYHPGFRGRSSIKVTLPTLVGDTYEGLAIRDGDSAVATFARMARGEITGTQAEEVRKNLLAYCKQDTHGMVRLHHELVRLVSSPKRK